MSNQEYTNQHYAPQTYTKPWKDDGSFKLIDKAIDKHSGELWSPKGRFYFEEYYTLGYHTPFCLNDNEISKIFGLLDNFVVEFNGNTIVEHKHYASSFKYFDEWIIKDIKTQKPISDAKRKDIENTIKSDDNRILNIEFGWHKYENSWHGIRSEVIEVLNGSRTNLSSETYSVLKRFIGIQKWRGEEAYKEVKEISDFVMGLNRNPNDKINSDENEEMAKQQFLCMLRKFIDGDKCSVIQKEINACENLALVIYKTPTNVKLFTSDNPVIIVQDEDIYKDIYNGLYFPITPRLLIGLFNGDPTEYYIETLSKELVEKLNNKIADKAIRYYLSQ